MRLHNRPFRISSTFLGILHSDFADDIASSHPEWWLHKAKQSMSEPYKHLRFKCCCVLEPVELQDVSISCSNAHL